MMTMASSVFLSPVVAQDDGFESVIRNGIEWLERSVGTKNHEVHGL